MAFKYTCRFLIKIFFVPSAFCVKIVANIDFPFYNLTYVHPQIVKFIAPQADKAQKS
jgi:hypothetical protein